MDESLLATPASNAYMQLGTSMRTTAPTTARNGAGFMIFFHTVLRSAFLIDAQYDLKSILEQIQMMTAAKPTAYVHANMAALSFDVIAKSMPTIIHTKMDTNARESMFLGRM